MQNWSVDHQPLLTKLRPTIDRLPDDGNRLYHVFLCPPYALPTIKNLPEDYIYYSVRPHGNILYNLGDPNFRIKFEDGKVVSVQGFLIPLSIPVLLTTYCSNIKGLDFNVHEIENDFYDRSRKIHPFYAKVCDCYKNPEKSIEFIESEFADNILVTRMFKAIDSMISKVEITSDNMETFMERLQISIENIATEIFRTSIVDILPVSGKQKLNHLIFNAITSKAHSKLFAAYTEKYSQQDALAKKNIMQHIMVTKASKDKMREAAKYLSGIINYKSPCDMVNNVAQFFEAVVASLPGNNVAADDILPAVCSALQFDIGMACHVVSFFTYLQELWPQVGLDDKYTYIIVSCAIASMHLSSTPQNNDEEELITPNHSYISSQSRTMSTELISQASKQI